MSSSLLNALRAARTALNDAVTVEPVEAALSRRLGREIDDAIARLEGGEPGKDLVSIVCHDLKDPLASIVMGAGFLKKTIAPDEAGAQTGGLRVVAAIARSADRMTQVVSDFHDLAKLETGLLPFEPRPCDVVAAVRGALGSFEAPAHEKRIAVRLEATEERAVAVCDRARLLQIIAKLVGNAIKFTAPEGQVVVRVVGEHARIRISVADTGRGIAPERVPAIFDHAANARRTPRDGPGLGLPIVRGLVELHGGELTVESRDGEGSTFSFTLPRG